MTAFSPLRVGLIGLGRMGARLAVAAGRAGLTVVAALDKDANAFALTDQPALRAVFTDDSEKFWATPMDVLVVGTTAPSHAGLVREGLARGIRRFMVEKPFTTCLGDGRALLAEAEAVGARVVVNHGRRYSPNYRALAALDGSPEMGTLRAVTVTMGGGAFGCLGVHFFDMVSQLMGCRPDSVMARLTTPLTANPRGVHFADPGGTAVLFYPGGRRALIDMGDDVGVMGRVECLYNMGRVQIDNEAQPWRVFRRFEADRALPMTRYGQPLEEAGLDGFRPFDVIDAAEAAIRDAAGDGPVASGAEAALGSLEIFSAIHWSDRTGLPVSLPLPPEAEAVDYPIP